MNKKTISYLQKKERNQKKKKKRTPLEKSIWREIYITLIEYWLISVKWREKSQSREHFHYICFEVNVLLNCHLKKNQ